MVISLLALPIIPFLLDNSEFSPCIPCYFDAVRDRVQEGDEVDVVLFCKQFLTEGFVVGGDEEREAVEEGLDRSEYGVVDSCVVFACFGGVDAAGGYV